ncbi:MAG: glutathione S-transferase C-terminal domain-containing protein [Pseudomonadota bacterium]
MGQLVAGQWTDEDQRGVDAHGRFVRPDSPWRRWVTTDADAEFPAAAGRYHLYVNVGCPWAYRAVLYRALKGLEDVISMSCTAPGMGREGWTFLDPDSDGASRDDFTGHAHMHQVYSAADGDFTGRVTVPVLWDRERQTIVNNESSEIIRMLNSAFDAWAAHPDIDYYPEPLRPEIDAINERVYAALNNGVYRAGFARSQSAYEAACREVFAELDACEARLSRQRYLVGERITEADWRLFSTLLRFDLAYYPVFRCNLRRLVDYPNLWAYARDLYQQPRVAETVDWDAFKGIYWSRVGMIPLGPDDDWHAPHGR